MHINIMLRHVAAIGLSTGDSGKSTCKKLQV